MVFAFQEDGALYIFWFICRRILHRVFPSSQRGDRGFGLPYEKLYLIKRPGTDPRRRPSTRTRKLRRGRWLVTSRGIAGKKHDSSGPWMDDESILLDVERRSILGYLGSIEERRFRLVEKGRGETVEYNSRKIRVSKV